MTNTPHVRAMILCTVALFALGGCATAPIAAQNGEEPLVESVSTETDIEAASELAMTRYELVRDGDYEGACALYSEKFTANFLELANAEGETCAQAHALAVATSDKYLREAADQGRLALTPFFYIPSAIKIDSSETMGGDEGSVFLAPGTIISLDPTEFEDGVGQVPGWLGSSWVKRFPDGTWRFIDMTEN